MIICEVTKVLQHGAFELKSDSKEFHVVLEFYGVNTPQVGDKILIHEKLLDQHWEGYKQPYAFQVITDVYPKQVLAENSTEFIVLGTKTDNYTLKRIYG